nr:streptophobe family protein [Streptomyces somaliensis]
MFLLLLAYVVLGLAAGLAVAATRGHAADTLAVLLLGLPNLAWLALGLGVGASWEGRVDGPFGLPVPRVLDRVLRGPGDTVLDVRSLAAHDERAWWLVPLAAVLLLAAAFAAAVRSRTPTRPWRHALHLGVAFPLTLLAVVPLTRVDARLGLSLLDFLEADALGGRVGLRPRLWTAVGLALPWGAAAGFLGGLLAQRVRRRGRAGGRPPRPPGEPPG